MKEPRTVSKATFECLGFVILTMLMLVELVLLLLFSRVLRMNLPSAASWGGAAGWVCTVVFPNILFSRVATDRLLKVLGLSRSGITREIQGRSVALPEGQVEDDEAVAVYASRSTCQVMMVLSLVNLLIFSLSVKFLGRGELVPIGYYWAYFLIALSAFGVVFFWVLPCIPLAQADAEGIPGEGFSAFAKFIPWSEVATCEIETVFNTFGNPVFVQPTLKDKHGEKLLRFDLWFARIEERDRLVNYIKAKLPKPELDSWDADGEF